jgi:hypothetical protein
MFRCTKSKSIKWFTLEMETGEKWKNYSTLDKHKRYIVPRWETVGVQCLLLWHTVCEMTFTQQETADKTFVFPLCLRRKLFQSIIFECKNTKTFMTFEETWLWFFYRVTLLYWIGGQNKAEYTIDIKIKVKIQWPTGTNKIYLACNFKSLNFL